MTPLGKGHQMPRLPAQVRDGLLYDGDLDGLHSLKAGA